MLTFSFMKNFKVYLNVYMDSFHKNFDSFLNQQIKLILVLYGVYMKPNTLFFFKICFKKAHVLGSTVHHSYYLIFSSKQYQPYLIRSVHMMVSWEGFNFASRSNTDTLSQNNSQFPALHQHLTCPQLVRS